MWESNINADIRMCLSFVLTEELPDGFSQQLQEENQKSRPKFQPPQQKPAAQSHKESNARKETPKVCVLTCAILCSVTEPLSLCVCGVCQVTEQDDAAGMKDWILRYAEQSSDDEEQEEEGKQTRNPELEEKFDPVS